MTSKQFIAALKTHQNECKPASILKFFHGDDGETKALGVKFGTVFKLAKEYIGLPLDEIDKLLDSTYYEVRMGAVAIMDLQAKSKKTSAQKKEQLFNLYLDRHDRLNDWGFVDRGAYNIIGEYLVDKPRTVLYDLAKSEMIWERRTSIVATYAFIKRDELDDTFEIAEILVNDKHELINKAVGSWIREAGKRDEERLRKFLDRHGATMPRVTLRYAIEKMDEASRKYYMSLSKL